MISREDNEKLDIIKNAIALLDKAVLLFGEKIGKPEWIQSNNTISPQYKNPTSLHFQVLMSVRIASGLHAAEKEVILKKPVS